jgi:hypothetical protein
MITKLLLPPEAITFEQKLHIKINSRTDAQRKNKIDREIKRKQKLRLPQQRVIKINNRKIPTSQQEQSDSEQATCSLYC